MDDIEGRVTYQRSRFEGGTDLNPPDWHHGDWGHAQVRGEPIVCQERSKKDGICHKDIGVKGIQFKVGSLLTPVGPLKNYFVLTYWTIHGLYLCQEALVHCLILSWSNSLLKYKCFPIFLPDRLREPCNKTGRRRSSQSVTISWGHLGLIQDSLNLSETWTGKYTCSFGRCCGHLCLWPIQCK